MGLYKKNYEVKDLGITLPEAFAIVRKIDRQGNKGMAELWVHSSRENAKTLQFLERKLVPFKCNDGDNPYEAAYTEATKQREVKTRKPKEIVAEDGTKTWKYEEVTKIECYFDGWGRD
jgi:hypothetical protein